MTVPPWAAAVQQLADGRWQPLLLVTDAVPTEEAARSWPSTWSGSSMPECAM